ncbi:unnamed protein product, partial [Mesorhabditis belari]|uniref:Uncharacterized protein n=1 Tax=Mesorhabditis belari TaxID=2138241 RepID=A0AAF3EZA7_9BILA
MAFAGLFDRVLDDGPSGLKRRQTLHGSRLHHAHNSAKDAISNADKEVLKKMSTTSYGMQQLRNHAFSSSFHFSQLSSPPLRESFVS